MRQLLLAQLLLFSSPVRYICDSESKAVMTMQVHADHVLTSAGSANARRQMLRPSCNLPASVM